MWLSWYHTVWPEPLRINSEISVVFPHPASAAAKVIGALRFAFNLSVGRGRGSNSVTARGGGSFVRRKKFGFDIENIYKSEISEIISQPEDFCERIVEATIFICLNVNFPVTFRTIKNYNIKAVGKLVTDSGISPVTLPATIVT